MIFPWTRRSAKEEKLWPKWGLSGSIWHESFSSQGFYLNLSFPQDCWLWARAWVRGNILHTWHEWSALCKTAGHERHRWQPGLGVSAMHMQVCLRKVKCACWQLAAVAFHSYSTIALFWSLEDDFSCLIVFCFSFFFFLTYIMRKFHTIYLRDLKKGVSYPLCGVLNVLLTEQESTTYFNHCTV